MPISWVCSAIDLNILGNRPPVRSSSDSRDSAVYYLRMCPTGQSTQGLDGRAERLERLSKHFPGGHTELAGLVDIRPPTYWKYKSGKILRPARDKIISFGVLEAAKTGGDHRVLAAQWLRAFGLAVPNQAELISEVESIRAELLPASAINRNESRIVSEVQSRWARTQEFFAGAPFEGSVRGLMNALDQGDAWFYMSVSEHPLGISVKRGGKSASARVCMVHAAIRGASFCIVRPDAKFIEQAQRYLGTVPAVDSILREFESFKDAGIPPIVEDYNTANSASIDIHDVQTRFTLAWCSQLVMPILPRHRFGLIRSRPDPSPFLAAFELVPSSAGEIEKEYPLHLPLDEHTAQTLNEIIAETLKTQSQSTPEIAELIRVLST